MEGGGGGWRWLKVLALVGLIVEVSVPAQGTRWSPYYMVVHNLASGFIAVNTIAHQTMVPFGSRGPGYSLIHLLQQQSGGAPFRDVLIIGAGSGNDIAHALRFGASQIDAVEIDPVIQDIGIQYHPDRPYQDTRVIRHLDDGRHFLRTTERKYHLCGVHPRRFPDPAQRLREHPTRKLPFHAAGLCRHPAGTSSPTAFSSCTTTPPGLDRGANRGNGGDDVWLRADRR